MFGGPWYITFFRQALLLTIYPRTGFRFGSNSTSSNLSITVSLLVSNCLFVFCVLSMLFDDLYWVKINLCLVLRFVINIFEKTMVFFTFWGDENEVSGVLIPFLRRHQGAVSISTIRMDELVTKNHFYNYPIKDKRIWKWLRCLYRPQVWHNFNIYFLFAASAIL